MTSSLLQRSQFNYGDTNENDEVFVGYRVLKSGDRKERWVKRKDFNDRQIYQKEYNRTPKGRSSQLIRHAKRRAIIKNLECNLKMQDVLPILQKGNCELTGLAFDLSSPKDTQYNPYAPSLDRIDNKKGYTKDNVRVVLAAVNTALNQYGDKIMLPILEALVKAIKNA